MTYTLVELAWVAKMRVYISWRRRLAANFDGGECDETWGRSSAGPHQRSRQTSTRRHPDEDKLAAKAKIARNGNDGWGFFGKNATNWFYPASVPRAVTEYEERDNQNAANIEGTQITRGENSRNNPNLVDASKECNFKRLKYSSQIFLAAAVRYF